MSAALKAKVQEAIEAKLTSLYAAVGDLSPEELADFVDGAQEAVMGWLPADLKARIEQDKADFQVRIDQAQAQARRTTR